MLLISDSKSVEINPDGNAIVVDTSFMETWYESWWSLMQGDQIPLSLKSVSVSFLIAVIGLLANFCLVILIIKSVMFWTNPVPDEKKSTNPSFIGSMKNPSKAYVNLDLDCSSYNMSVGPTSKTRIVQL